MKGLYQVLEVYDKYVPLYVELIPNAIVLLYVSYWGLWEYSDMFVHVCVILYLLDTLAIWRVKRQPEWVRRGELMYKKMVDWVKNDDRTEQTEYLTFRQTRRDDLN